MLTCILGFQAASNIKLPPYWIKALQGRLVYENWWSDNLLLFIYIIPNNYQLEPGFDSTVSNWYLVGRTFLSLIHVSMQLSHVHLQKEKSHHRIQRQITFRPKPHFSEKISGLTGIEANKWQV